MEINRSKYLDRLYARPPYDIAGKVTKSLGLIYEAFLPGVGVGSVCRILLDAAGTEWVDAEVIGFRDKKVILMPFDTAAGINNDSLVRVIKSSATFMVGPELLGRVIDGRGVPIDGKGDLVLSPKTVEERKLYERPSDPLKRTMISEPLDLGVRAINGFLTVGKGQRLGIMAGSGVGKSVLLGMLARNSNADINVIALIGERGREVREFIERDLGEEGLKRSVVIVVTSDQSPLLRTRGAFIAASVAEYFRDQGKDVLMMMDSVTRFCMAQREIGLSNGEPPASKGYTPSVFALLPKLLERAGMGENGSITGLFTVLVEGDDMDEPVADSARSILDGHIVLTRKLAHRNHFPAIDILQSTSRVMPLVTDENHRKWAGQMREWLSVYSQAEDLINVGAYVKGSNVKIDQAVAVIDRINGFLRQGMHEKSPLGESLSLMLGTVRAGEAATQGR